MEILADLEGYLVEFGAALAYGGLLGGSVAAFAVAVWYAVRAWRGDR